MAFAFLALLGTIVLALSRWLVPDPHGFGTHTQLGLPACLFLTLTGLPCPACGLTTSFAHMAHGHFVLALQANPIGVPLFAAVAAGVPACVWAAARRRTLCETCARTHLTRALVVLACAALVQWVVRVGCLLSG